MSKSMAGEGPSLRSPDNKSRTLSPYSGLAVENAEFRRNSKTSSSLSDIPLAHRNFSASVTIVNGQLFRRTSIDPSAEMNDDKWEENTSEDKVVLRGWFECRKKRRFAKYKKEWKPKFFLLLKDSLVYFDSVEDHIMRGKYPLLGATVKTWKSYKDGAAPPERTHEKEYSVSRTKSVTKPAEALYEPPEERTLVLITSDSQTLYIRFMKSVEMLAWYDAIEDCAAKLVSKYTPTFEAHGLELKVITAGKDGDKNLSFNLEASSGELRWKFWRSYEDFQNNHTSCVEKVMVHVKGVEIPRLPPSPADENDLRPFLNDIREYLDKLTHIEAVAHSPEFLTFAGLVSTRQVPSTSVAIPRQVLSWDLVKDFAKTGDIILVSNSHWVSQVQRSVTHAAWDHVGMILTYPTNSKRDLSKLFIIEATSADGVKKYPLRMRLQQMSEKCTVGYRKLDWNATPASLQALQVFVDEVEGKPYSLKGLINDSTEQFFCSQLVAEAYKAMGVIADTAKSGTLLPKDFSSASNSLPFLEGSVFEGEECLIDFREEPEVSKSKTTKEIEESKSRKSKFGGNEKKAKSAMVQPLESKD